MTLRYPMKTIRIPLLSLLVILSGMAGSLQAQSLEETFLKGNIAYGNGDLDSAEKAYRLVLESVQSAEVHYNLGNTLAQKGEWSEAAFHFMQAYSLDPNMESAQANLMLAANRMGLGKDYPDLPTPAKFMSERQWTTTAAALFWVALILFFHGDFIRYKLPLHKTLGTISLLLMAVAVTGIIQHKLFRDWAVVSTSLASLRVAPTEQSPGESVLIEGDPIRILGEQKGFFHVMTSAGDEGFILREEVYSVSKD